ncbi:protein takeout-like [Episyrphus balteatus]|uniref:protein takeout-like n=1 Tax=Episyrphus balteatus TaxID=286459 RepID=UPI0024862C99|nr:protein takeout-like [Episyrphus balteatus]
MQFLREHFAKQSASLKVNSFICNLVFNMIRSTFYGILIVLILVQFNEGKLPADIKPCKAGDKTCLVETINKIIETKYKGDPDLNLISIDPLHIDHMEIKQPKSSAVSVDLSFRNSDVFGYKTFRAYKVRGFKESPEGKHVVYFKGPYASLVGEYAIDGKILILPIVGKGTSNITLENVYVQVLIDAGSKVKDGATYMDVKNVKLNLNTTKVDFKMDNLFNGDKELGDNLNKFMNENWMDIYSEIRQGVLDGFGKVYTEFIRNLFASHPYNELIEGGN